MHKSGLHIRCLSDTTVVGHHLKNRLNCQINIKLKISKYFCHTYTFVISGKKSTVKKATK